MLARPNCSRPKSTSASTSSAPNSPPALSSCSKRPKPGSLSSSPDYYLGEADLDSSHWESAEVTLQAALAADPESAANMALLATAIAKQGRIAIRYLAPQRRRGRLQFPRRPPREERKDGPLRPSDRIAPK